MNKLVVFASGSGTNFQAVIDAVESGKIDAQISGLLVNRTGIKATERAEVHGIPVEILSPSDFENKKKYTERLLEILREWDPDLIVLAGYLLKIPDEVIEQYPDRIINIHPSLLPEYGGKGYYGMKVHEAVINDGETVSGCSVHLVTSEYDAGPVLAQRKVPVHPDDDAEALAERVLKEEHRLLPEVIAKMLQTLES